MRILLLLVLSSLLNVVNVQSTVAQSKVQITKTDIKSYNGSHVSCAEANDGEITVTAKGGSGQYEYSKDGGNTYQSGNVFTGLVHNTTYPVFVRDVVTKQVSDGKWVTLKHLNAVTISSQLQVIRQPKCFSSSDGEVLLTAFGGTGNLQYSIDNGRTFQHSGRFSNLPAGTYQVFIIDENGCNVTSNKITLKGPAELGIEISNLTNASCTRLLGNITFKGTGSTGDYNYSIDGQSFTWKSRNEYHTFSNLAIGSHQILIQDNYNKCLFAYNFEITNSLSATLSAQETICQEKDLYLVINIKGSSIGQANETFTATFKDDHGKVVTKPGLGGGNNFVSVGKLTSSTTFKLMTVKSSSGCSAYVADNESLVTLLQAGKWLGYTSDWHNPKNWSCESVPDLTTNVVIGRTNNNPVIDKNTAFANGLSIENGAALTVTGLLQISGYFKNDDGVFDVTEGSLEFNGGKGQKIQGFFFKNRTIKNLIVSNTAGLKLSDTPGDTLNITGNLTFGTKTASLFTGDNITLKSTIDGTANIGVVGKENTIQGKFIVERYINTGTDKSLGQHGKAWMLLATPTIGSAIFESWQEGGKATGKTPIINNQSGYGTLLTTPFNNVPANGFDLYTGAGASIKTYDSKTGTFDNGPKSTNEPIYNEKGYLVMVRGDRSVYTHNAAAVPVVLRTKGEILTGTTKEIKVAAGKWQSVGNPYASRIYINNIQRRGGVDEFITVWDPKLGGSYGLGAYQTLVNMGSNYMAIPGGGSYGKEAVTFIESGQAFFVQATKEDGSVYFTEDAKVPSIKNKMGRGAGAGSKVSFLRSNLYALGTGDAVLSDGNILLTGDYSNDIDGMDGRKMDNSAESFSIFSSGQKLSVESRRDIITNDTILYNMASMRAQKYRLEMIAESLGTPGMFGWLEDKFTGTKTFLNLNGTTEYVFTVSSEKGSAASDRFMIVFRPAAVLPVTFTDVKATKSNENILVEWTVEAESNLKQYEVEKSVDGNTFSKAATVATSNINGGKYQWLDQTPASGYNYYRIRSVDMDGKTALTQIVKVNIETSIGSISVYPNPITNGTVNLQLGNQPEGVYNLRLLNPVGQVLLTTKINHAGGNHTEKINWDHSLPRGMYTLEVSNTLTGVKLIKLMY